MSVLIAINALFFMCLLISITLVVRTFIETAKVSRGDAGGVPFVLGILTAASWTGFFFLVML